MDESERLLRAGRRKQIWRKCERLARMLCCAVALAVLGVFCWQLGQGIAKVCEGEITSAQMLEEMGAWMRGGGS